MKRVLFRRILLAAGISVLTWLGVASILFPSQTNQGSAGSPWGRYWALIVGINDYKEWPRLETAAADARELKKVLEEEYGFSPERIKLLLDREATLSRITAELRDLAGSMGEQDNLLIYFAGHDNWMI